MYLSRVSLWFRFSFKQTAVTCRSYLFFTVSHETTHRSAVIMVITNLHN